MAKYQNRGQGTLAAILGVVVFFMVVDVIITIFLICNINVKELIGKLSNTDNTAIETLTDNSINTDN